MDDLTDEQKKDLKEFLDTLKKDYRYNIELFDKQSVYIAGGALAISLTFIKDIVPLDISISLWLYYVSISFFALSILLSFLSFLISSEIIIHNKRVLERSKKGKYKVDKTTTIFNFIVAGLISIGIILVVIFTISNLNNYKINSNNLKLNTMEEKEKRFVKTDSDNTVMKSLRSDDLPESLRSVYTNQATTSTTNSSSGTDTSSQQSTSDDKGKK